MMCERMPRLDRRKNVFTKKVINNWNKLTNKVWIFENKLDRL